MSNQIEILNKNKSILLLIHCIYLLAYIEVHCAYLMVKCVILVKYTVAISNPDILSVL